MLHWHCQWIQRVFPSWGVKLGCSCLCVFCLSQNLLWKHFFFTGGPGVHDPCERDPTDVLSDLSAQQADTITHSAQVRPFVCCQCLLAPAASEMKSQGRNSWVSFSDAVRIGSSRVSDMIHRFWCSYDFNVWLMWWERGLCSDSKLWCLRPEPCRSAVKAMNGCLVDALLGY